MMYVHKVCVIFMYVCICISCIISITLQTMRQLNDIYVKLRELGHPDYLKGMLSHNHVLPCTLGKSEADHKVSLVSCGSLLLYTCIGFLPTVYIA